MSKTLIGVLSFVAGAAISGVATYFVTKKIEKAKAEIYIQQQLNKDRKAMKEDNAEEKIDIEEVKQDAIDEYCEQVRKDRKEYRDIAHKYSSSSFVPFDSEAPDVKDALERSRVEDKYIITEEEYGDCGFDKVNLYYHPDADDIADDNGELQYPDETIGSRIFNKFVADQDVDELFVRNETNGKDYYIIKELLK